MRLCKQFCVFLAPVLFFGALVAGRPQQNNFPPSKQTAPMSGANFPDKAAEDDPALRSMQAAQGRARNDDRQKRLVADTDKLLALATQLHADVAKTDKNVLSMDVIRRSEEIEKLAHNIKERMKG